MDSAGPNDDIWASIDVTDRVSKKVAQMIIEEAQAAGFTFRPGHHRSTSTKALTRMIEKTAGAFIVTHMRRNEKSAPTPPERDEG